MKRLGPAAEFEHLPQNRDALSRRSLSEDIQHRARRVGIGVVAIVKNQNTVVMKTFAPHLSRSKTADPFRQPLQRDSVLLRDGDSRQQIRDSMAAGKGTAEWDILHTKLDA